MPCAPALPITDNGITWTLYGQDVRPGMSRSRLCGFWFFCCFLPVSPVGHWQFQRQRLRFISSKATRDSLGREWPRAYCLATNCGWGGHSGLRPAPTRAASIRHMGVTGMFSTTHPVHLPTSCKGGKATPAHQRRSVSSDNGSVRDAGTSVVPVWSINCEGGCLYGRTLAERSVQSITMRSCTPIRTT